MFDMQLNGELEDKNSALEFLNSVAAVGGKPGEYLKQTQDGVILCLHVVPGAKRTEFSGLHGDRLKLRVAAPPVDDAANRAIESFLDKFFKAKTEIVNGKKSRKKDVLVRSLDVESICKLLRATDGKADITKTVATSVSADGTATDKPKRKLGPKSVKKY